MTNLNFEIKMETDDDGYATFECPFCESTFGLSALEVNDEKNSIYNEMYCPYCGLSDEINHFYPKEVIEQVKNMAINYMNDEINKMFSKMIKSTNNKYIKMTYKPLKNRKIENIKTQEGTENTFECHNCKNHIKVEYCVGKAKVFCTYCGLDI